MTQPARLTVVFRRGPAKMTATYAWDRRRRGELPEQALVHDFNGLAFEAMEAPS